MSSLLSALNTGESALRTSTTALRITGHNIANAATEGFSRQRVEVTSTEPDDFGNIQVGTGVQASEVRRVVDETLELFLRQSAGDLGSAGKQSEMLGRIEAAFNELGGQGLSNTLAEFFDALDGLVENPSDTSTRQEVVSAAVALADAFNTLDGKLKDLRAGTDEEVVDTVERINSLTSQIAQLNGEILQREHGGREFGDANDLRDRRDKLVRDLSGLLEVRAVETERGSVNVLVGSDFLVFDDDATELTTTRKADNGVLVSLIQLAVNGKSLSVGGGELEGMLIGRDKLLTRFLDDISKLANAIIYQINQAHAQGVGTETRGEVTGTEPVADPNAALNAAGLPFQPVNGAFELNVLNRLTGTVKTFDVEVDLDGVQQAQPDTTLASLVADINQKMKDAGLEVEASVSATGEFRMESKNDELKFFFGNDTSGALAALGVNTLFEGSDAASMGVNREIVSNLALLAAARSLSPGDNTNAVALSQLRETRMLENGNASMADAVQGIVARIAVQAQSARGKLENQQALDEQLRNEREAVSGVSLDEEAINLITYQKAFQGAARYIAAVDEMLNALLQLV